MDESSGARKPYLDANPWKYPGNQTTAELIHVGMGYQIKQLARIIERGVERGEVEINDLGHGTLSATFRYKDGKTWIKARIVPHPSCDPEWPWMVEPLSQ